MTKSHGTTDKNLQNVAFALETEGVTSQQAQQLQQEKNDRRHADAVNHQKTKDMDPSH